MNLGDQKSFRSNHNNIIYIIILEKIYGIYFGLVSYKSLTVIYYEDHFITFTVYTYNRGHLTFHNNTCL